jgi:hypothetical protein
MRINMSWEPRSSNPGGRYRIEYRDGLCSYALILARNHAEAGDLRASYTGIGEASRLQHEGLALHDPKEYLVQPVEKVTHWSSND